ncbi:coiled-coil domain-containing 92B [Latimeria chalumnae]|uniref:coiled-coil domain-containing 92B n=1 Tax=Latimeria chalumnae TaxID=7897 RepID=UPI00313CF859
MEASPLEHQIQSVQRNIAFLKKAQMELLHDLHIEILHLEKHCTELTCELETRSAETSQSDDCGKELEERCKNIEAKISEKECENTELRKELKHKESLVAALRASLREKERKFLEELKRRSHRVTILNTELQKQTESAAYLSFQLHAVKQKLVGSRQTSRSSDRPPDRSLPMQFASEVKTTRNRSHKVHSRKSGTEHTLDKGSLKDSVHTRRQSNIEELEPMPDPALFLQPRRYHGHRQRPDCSSQVLCSHAFSQKDSANSFRAQRPSKPEEAEPSTIRSSIKTNPALSGQGQLNNTTQKTDTKK